ncbi:YdeI/OmpD-associated family protein [Sorangium sp. So ce260]|uniref:YdeI/OmpD-associated family protein n=1 Tax=Sorangium sp. So ce260 TaxID=3133291 RepID=UPI003F638664
MSDDSSGLKRPRHPMPDFIKDALKERGLMDAYKERPAYQQNDYIGWINQAKHQETKEKRLHQMLDELAAGGVYMNMKHPASEKK